PTSLNVIGKAFFGRHLTSPPLVEEHPSPFSRRTLSNRARHFKTGAYIPEGLGFTPPRIIMMSGDRRRTCRIRLRMAGRTARSRLRRAGTKGRLNDHRRHTGMQIPAGGKLARCRAAD